MEVGMELRALRAHHAVDWPDSTLLAERTVFGRMPVARGEDREPARAKRGHIKVQDRDDLVTSRDSKRAAWQKIVLDVHDQQAVAWMEVHVNPPRSFFLIVYPTRRRRQLSIFHPYRMKRGSPDRSDQDSPAPSCAVLRLQASRTRSQSQPARFVRTSSRHRPPLPCPGTSCIRHAARDRSAWTDGCSTAP